MRFMMLVKATKESEAGKMPDEKSLSDMGTYNEKLVKAGVIDGPFTEAKELIAGYWLIQAKSREEAVEWAKRVPFVDGEIEIRQLFELEDFTPSPAIDKHRQI